MLRFEDYLSTLFESVPKLTQGSRFPVRLRPICRQLSVHGIRREKLQGSKSLLIDARVKPIIIINSSRTVAPAPNNSFTSWERFLIAHELGHLVLQQHGAKNPSGPSEYWKLEQICDAFARRLLIPDEFVTRISEEAGKSAIERLRATFLVAKQCTVPWSAAALRLTEEHEGAVFFQLVPVSTGGFKVLVSTYPNRRGLGQHIKPGTNLHGTLSRQILAAKVPQEVEGRQLSGIAGIKDIQLAVAYPSSGGLRLAVVPS